MMHFDYYVQYSIEGQRECKGFEARVYAETFIAYLHRAGIAAEMYSL